LNKKRLVKRVPAKKKIMGRGIGELVFFETGCRLSSEFKKAGLKSKCLCLEVVHPESSKIKLPPLNLKQKIWSREISCHYKRIYHNRLMEFHYNNDLFLTHMGNSTHHEFSSEQAQIWEKRIRDYFIK
jgi:hypothetical protein